MDEILNVIYSSLLTIGIGVVGFFIKRCFSSLDGKADKTELEKHVDDFKDLRTEIEEKASKGEIQKYAEEMKELRYQYATKEEIKDIRSQMNEMKSSIEFLKEETVRKSDFIRVTTEISGKIDDLSKYLRGKLL